MYRTHQLALCLSLIVAAAGCNQLGATGPSTTPVRPEIGPAVRDYLASDEEEAEGYGFYTYLLLRQGPGPANLARYRAAFDAFLRILPSQEARESGAELNLTYTLVKTPPGAEVSAVMSGALPDDPRRRLAIDWLIENHDYGRSQQLLRKLGNASRGGPYIVQARRPLVAHPGNEPSVIVQDLSGFEADLTADLVEHVLRASDEKASWQDGELQAWLLSVRNVWERLGVNAKRVVTLVDVLPLAKLLDPASASTTR
jgi:hypothetical protein